MLNRRQPVIQKLPPDGVSALSACQLILLPLRLAQFNLLHTDGLLRQGHQGVPVHFTALGAAQCDALDQGLKVSALTDVISLNSPKTPTVLINCCQFADPIHTLMGFRAFNWHI